MVNTFTLDLFKDPFFVGFDRQLDRMLNVHNVSSQINYPPYNVVKVNEDEYVVHVAVAGFSKDDVDVSVDNGSLIIKGEISESTDEIEYVHKGIAGRKFTRTFALGEYMEVTGAKMENGMLEVTVERIVPEEKKPKTIKIK